MSLANDFQLLSPVWTHLTQIAPIRGEGIYLFDGAGDAYMDFTSGIGVVNTGHCHPRVVKAVQEQADKLLFGQMNIVVLPEIVALARKLNNITPDSINRFFFSNSGAEAVEGAVKLARQATGRRNIIVFQGSFHGRTHQAMAMTTSKYVYRYDYQPLPGGIIVAPFPAAYRYGWNEHQATEFCLKELDLILHSQSAPDETAMMIIEPVLGEGGYIPAPAEFLVGLRDICRKHNILLALDEVQSGFGRTGKWFGYEHANIEPDILVLAKGLGSGLPISAVAASDELMDKWKPGTHGGTYGGGSAIAAVAACATIDVIDAEDLTAKARENGEYLTQELRRLQEKFPSIGDVRGPGLMIATEFSHADGTPDPLTTSRVQQSCLKQGLLLLSCGSYGNVIRWVPPLIVSEEQLDDALAIFDEALQSSQEAGRA